MQIWLPIGRMDETFRMLGAEHQADLERHAQGGRQPIECQRAAQFDAVRPAFLCGSRVGH